MLKHLKALHTNIKNRKKKCFIGITASSAMLVIVLPIENVSHL